MNAPFKAPADPLDAPLWDLSDLYASRDDARIDADLERARGMVTELNALQGQLVGARADAATLGQRLDRAVTLYEQASDVLGGLGAYAFLAASTNRNDAGATGFEATVRERMTAIATPTVWVTLEVNQLEEAEIEAALAAHPAGARWRPWLRRVRAMKPHELSQELETFLAERGPISAQWPRLFDETLAAMKVKAGKEELTLAEALNRLSDPKAARRKSAAEGLNEALGQRTATMALVINT
ncbi:MAG: M3 family oligoendopeptidase, partial [Brevundimonas sp.]